MNQEETYSSNIQRAAGNLFVGGWVIFSKTWAEYQANFKKKSFFEPFYPLNETKISNENLGAWKPFLGVGNKFYGKSMPKGSKLCYRRDNYSIFGFLAPA